MPEVTATQFDPEAILRDLAAAGVEFILVGGLAAVIQGTPVATFDVDIVHRRTPENVELLLRVLEHLDAHYRGRPPEQRIKPQALHLSGTGHQLLGTVHGPLDVLGAIEEGLDFDQLVDRAETIDLEGHPVRVLGLEALVDLKSRSSRPKDQARLELMRATLAERG